MNQFFHDIVLNVDLAKKFDGDIEVVRFTRVADNFIAAEQSMHRKIAAVGGLCILAGFVLGWLVFSG